MDISRFIYILLILSIAVLFYEKEQTGIQLDDEEKPSLSFYDSVAYEITKDGLKRVVQAKETYLYKEREELIEATVITKNSQENTDTSLVSGDYIVKIQNDIYLDGNVRLQLPNSTDIQTEQLEYNLETKIAKNSTDFEMIKDENTFDGTNVYVDITNSYIKAKNAQMRIKVLNE